MMTSAGSPSRSLVFAIMLYPITSIAQSIVVEDKTNDINPPTETRNIDSPQKSIDSAVETAPEALSTRILNSSLSPGFPVSEMLEDRDMNDDDYVASIDLGRLIWSGDGFGKTENPFGHVVLGLKRPYYRLGGDTRLVGLVDLNAAGSLAGLGNSVSITFRYDFRRDHDENSVKMSMFFVYVSYKINIPFGSSGETRYR